MDTALPDGRRGQILATAITLTVLATLWFGVMSPMIGWYEDRADELSQRRALLSRMQAVAETLPTLEPRPDDARPAESALLQGATDALAAATMQSAVQAMAGAAGLDLASMETLPAETRGNYRRIGLRVSLSASWPTLIALLRAAAQGQPHMLIDDLQVRATPLQARSADAPVNATFTLLAFRNAQAGGGS
jgi:general secretion pathway protein M